MTDRQQSPRLSGAWASFRSRPKPVSGVVVPAAVVIAILMPVIVGSGSLFFWTTVIISILFATAANLLFGVADIPSFGQAAFFGAGAYTAALSVPHQWPAPLALLAAIVVAGVTALIIAMITWRATGLAFAMLTLAIAQALYTLVVKTDALGGYNGLPGLVAPSLGPFNLASARTYWYFTLICVAVGMAAFWQIRRSPFGHMLASIRENPVRAAYLGINIRAYRAAAFAIAGCGAGLAGGLSAYANTIVTPDSLDWTQSAVPIIMLLLGGRAFYWGPALGAVILSWLLNDLSQVTAAYFFYIGVLLLVVLLVVPEGLLSISRSFRDWRSGAHPRPGRGLLPRRVRHNRDGRTT